MPRYDYRTRLDMENLSFLQGYSGTTGRPQTDLVNEAVADLRRKLIRQTAQIDGIAPPSETVSAPEKPQAASEEPETPRDAHRLEISPDAPLDVQISQARVRCDSPETYRGMSLPERQKLRTELEAKYNRLVSQQDQTEMD